MCIDDVLRGRPMCCELSEKNIKWYEKYKRVKLVLLNEPDSLKVFHGPVDGESCNNCTL